MTTETKCKAILSTLVLVICFAGVTLIVAAIHLDRLAHETTSISKTEDTIETSCVDEECTAILTFRDETVTVFKPAGWELSQSDAGGASAFVLSDTQNENLKIAFVFHQPINMDTNEPIPYSEWLLDNGFAIPISSSIIGVDKVSFDYYPSSTQIGFLNSYVTQLDPDKNIFLEVSRTETLIAPEITDRIINSINLNPNSTELLMAVDKLCP